LTNRLWFGHDFSWTFERPTVVQKKLPGFSPRETNIRNVRNFPFLEKEKHLPITLDTMDTILGRSVSATWTFVEVDRFDVS